MVDPQKNLLFGGQSFMDNRGNLPGWHHPGEGFGLVVPNPNQSQPSPIAAKDNIPITSGRHHQRVVYLETMAAD
jgi:hypothetical protein